MRTNVWPYKTLNDFTVAFLTNPQNAQEILMLVSNGRKSVIYDKYIPPNEAAKNKWISGKTEDIKNRLVKVYNFDESSKWGRHLLYKLDPPLEDN